MLKFAPKNILEPRWIDLSDGEKIKFGYLTDKQEEIINFLTLDNIDLETKNFKKLSEYVKIKQLTLKFAIKDWQSKNSEMPKCELIENENGTELTDELFEALKRGKEGRKQINILYDIYQENFKWDETDKKK